MGSPAWRTGPWQVGWTGVEWRGLRGEEGWAELEWRAQGEVRRGQGREKKGVVVQGEGGGGCAQHSSRRL